MNLIKGVMILSFGAMTLSATWFVGGHDLGKMPQKKEFVSVSNGGNLDDSQAMKDGVGVRLFGMGSDTIPSFREMNNLLLSAEPGEVVKDRDNVGDMFVRLPQGGGGESPFILDDCVISGNPYSRISCDKCQPGSMHVKSFFDEESEETFNFKVVIASNSNINQVVTTLNSDSDIYACTTGVTDMSGIFKEDTPVPESFSSFDFSNVIDASEMFLNNQNATWNAASTLRYGNFEKIEKVCNIITNSPAMQPGVGFRVTSFFRSLKFKDLLLSSLEDPLCNGTSSDQDPDPDPDPDPDQQPDPSPDQQPDNQNASCPTGTFNGSTITCGGCETGTSFYVAVPESERELVKVIVSSNDTIFDDLETSRNSQETQTEDKIYVCTSNLTSFAGVFAGINIGYLEARMIEKFDTSNVWNFNFMLKSSTPSSSLNIDNWNLDSFDTGCDFGKDISIPFDDRGISDTCVEESKRCGYRDTVC